MDVSYASATKRFGLTNEELRLYKEHFQEFDLNGDGVISACELEKVYRSLGYRMTKTKITEMMRALDLDESGTLSFDEFLLAMTGNSAIAKDEHRAARICRKFMEYDRDRDGHVTVEEAHEILRRELGLSLIDSVALVHKYDRNGDGQLSYEEFVKFYEYVCQKASQIRQMFRQFDTDGSGTISREEAKCMLGKLTINGREADKIIEIHDKNNDGELQYEEFVSLLLYS